MKFIDDIWFNQKLLSKNKKDYSKKSIDDYWSGQKERVDAKKSIDDGQFNWKEKNYTKKLIDENWSSQKEREDTKKSIDDGQFNQNMKKNAKKSINNGWFFSIMKSKRSVVMWWWLLWERQFSLYPKKIILLYLKTWFCLHMKTCTCFKDHFHKNNCFVFVFLLKLVYSSSFEKSVFESSHKNTYFSCGAHKNTSFSHGKKSLLYKNSYLILKETLLQEIVEKSLFNITKYVLKETSSQEIVKTLLFNVFDINT